MANYTNNVCPNPNFVTGLQGYTELPNTEITQTFTASGYTAMQVQTSGLGSGEGFYGPAVNFPASVTGSLSVALSGPAGQVQCSAVVNPGGVVLASQVVTLTNPLQTVQLNGLNIVAGTSLYILVKTLTPLVLSFTVNQVQYEPESPGHDYCDGSLPGCYWTGTPYASASYQPVQFPVSLVSGIEMSGTITIIQPGEIIPVTLESASVVSGGQVIGISVTEPPGAFDDFALFEATDVDPALSYAGWNNANQLTGQTGYNRNWGVFYPPLDYPASNGVNMWNRGAYMAMGHEFVNIPAGASQNMTLMQVEQLPLVGSGLDQTPSPSNYDTPRSIHVVVKPTRLNYIPNPSFEASLAGWLPIGAASTVQNHAVAPAALLTDQWSMLVLAHSAAEGAQVVVPDLFVGDTYTASAWVLPGINTADIAFTAGTYAGGTGQPPDLTPGQWVQTSVTFVASASTMVLTITPVLSALPTAAFPLTYNVDCCLIEAGEIVQPYFDGNFGNPDYMWETGGTPNSTRSYWYENFAVNQEVITDILQNHTPVGITPALPVYALPPTQ